MDRIRRWRAMLWGARRWIALACIVLVVLARVALPSVLRSVIVSQASQALHTRVGIGEVTLSLWNGTFGLHDVAVYPPDEAEGTALIGWKALDVELAYAALLHRTVRLSEVAFDTPRVALDRLADGALNLQKLVPPPAPSAPAPPAVSPAKEPVTSPGWGFVIDRFVLRGGGVRFRDLAVPQSQPLEAAIPAIEVADVSFQPGVYGQPTRLVVDVRSEGSRVRVVATLALLEHGVSVDADVEASRLPLTRARLYVPGVGWSGLAGFADAKLRYRLETEKTNELRGTLAVRGLEVKTPALAEPALAWNRLTVTLEPVDLLARNATISLVELKGAAVAASLQGGDLLPLVAGTKGAPPPAESAATTQTEAPPPPAKPWHWSVKRLQVEGSRLVVARPVGALPIGIALSANDLASDPGTIARVDLGLEIGAGSAQTSGRLRLSPPAFGGTLRYRQLDVRDLIPAVPTLPQQLVQSAQLGGELSVEAGIDGEGRPASADSVRLKGNLQIEKLRVSAADPKTFSAGWKRLAIAIDDARAPNVLAPEAPPSRAPLRVAIASLQLDEPFANLTRIPGGIALPDVGKSAAPQGKTAAKPAPAPAKAEPPAPSPEVRIAALNLRAGRVAIVDRTIKPFFSGEIKPIDLEVRRLSSLGPAVERFKLSAAGFQEGKVELTGALRANGEGNVEANLQRVGLTPFNPYVSSSSPYSLGKGSLSIASKVTFSTHHYETQNHVTVHELSLQGAEGDTLFSQHFGIPLSTALALLTDLHGDISLDVPVTVDKGAAKVDLVTVVAGALKSALLGAALSPLKILGEVAGLGGGSGAIEPQPIPSLVGRADPTPAGTAQIDQLANLLAGRPGIGLTLTGQVGEADLRWLREQKLRAKLEAGPGVVGAITGLPSRNARKRILQALADRAADKPGDLSADDGALLEEWLKDIAPLSPDELRGLARGRAERVAALLHDERGVDEKRLRAVDSASLDATAASPGVRVTIGLPTS